MYMVLNPKVKREIKERDNYTCHYCGCTHKFMMTIDHKKARCNRHPLRDSKSNLVCCCIVCNNLKGKMGYKEFINFLDNLNKINEDNNLILTMPKITMEKT